MPSSEEDWLAIEEGFRRNFPHCVGVLDGKHIVLQRPANSGSEYFNYKKTFSIVLLALVDSNYSFLYADIGSQGRISDGGVFRNCSLWGKMCSNSLNFPTPCSIPGSNVDTPFVFLADGAFALSTNVMKPYPGNHQIGSPKRIFNQRLSSSRVVVENAFGILSTVFRVFKKPISLQPDTAKIITNTCILLHNFLRRSSTSVHIYTPPGTLDVYDENGALVTPGSWRQEMGNSSAIRSIQSVGRRAPMSATKIREDFTSYFCKY